MITPEQRAEIDAHVDEMVADAPPLSDAQRDALRRIMHPSVTPVPVRRAAYAVSPSGRVARHPFATFPHAEAAQRWIDAHPDALVKFVPAMPEDDAR